MAAYEISLFETRELEWLTNWHRVILIVLVISVFDFSLFCQLMDELRRIVDQGNSRFLQQLETRWEALYVKAQFYGVYKKVMKPPLFDEGNYWLFLTLKLTALN